MTTVEILLMVGGKSGVELALNRVADYLSRHNCIIRFVQVIKTDYPWATKSASFHCLGMSSNLDMQKCIYAYEEYLKKNGKPDIILVAGMPAAVYIAKGALSALGINDCATIAWPHNDLSFYSDDSSEVARELNSADMIFAISDKIGTEAASMCPDKLIYRVNNTIDIQKLRFSDNRGSQKIAFIGRLSAEKNIGDIIRAISQTQSNWELYIIGDGDERSDLEKLTSSLDLSDKVHFLGWLDNPYMDIPDVRAMVMTSSTEGAPLSTIEALSCGMQVLSTPVGFNPEVIKNGENGYIFSGDVPKELARILDMLSNQLYSSETAHICRDSVADFMPEVALWDFLCKTVLSSRLVGLPHRNWRENGVRLVKSKMSVVVPVIDSVIGKIPALLDSLADQTMETFYMEIILVCAAADADIKAVLHQFEQSHSEHVMLVECSEAVSLEEAGNLGAGYASGDFILTINPGTDTLLPDTLENIYLNQLSGF